PASAQVQMADFAVPHLAFREADGETAGVEQRAWGGGDELVPRRCPGHRDGVPRGILAPAPPVEDEKDDRSSARAVGQAGSGAGVRAVSKLAGRYSWCMANIVVKRGAVALGFALVAFVAQGAAAQDPTPPEIPWEIARWNPDSFGTQRAVVQPGEVGG